MVFVNSFHQDPRNNKNPPDSPGKKNISPRFEPKPADAHIVRGPPSLCRSRELNQSLFQEDELIFLDLVEFESSQPEPELMTSSSNFNETYDGLIFCPDSEFQCKEGEAGQTGSSGPSWYPKEHPTKKNPDVKSSNVKSSTE